MTKVRKVDWWPDDWIAGTLLLNHEQRGVYDTLINLIYSNGGPVKASKEWPRAFGCDRERLWQILTELVDLEKITKKYNVFSNERCENEIEKTVYRIENARENGKTGGRGKRKNKDLQEPNPLADEKLTENLALTTTTTTITNDSSNEESTREARVSDFEQWWSMYPHKVGKGDARKAFLVAITKTSLITLIDGVKRYEANRPTDRPWCNPGTWLRQERWNDHPDDQSVEIINRTSQGRGVIAAFGDLSFSRDD